MEGNAIFQLEVHKNKDAAFSHSSSQGLCFCYHGSRLRNPDRENSLKQRKKVKNMVVFCDHAEHVKTQTGDDIEKTVKPSEVTNMKIHNPQLLNHRMCSKFQNNVFFWNKREMREARKTSFRRFQVIASF